MSKLALQAALQAFEAIHLREAVYVACPVSSGRRELDLMVELSVFDRDRLRDEHQARWRRDVLEPNKTAAAEAVSAARRRHADRGVINPAGFELKGFTQPEYDSLCAGIIRSHVGRLVLADGWQFSRGARLEAVLALELGLTVEDCAGRPLEPHRVRELIDVTPALVARGFPQDVANELLPDVALSPV